MKTIYLSISFLLIVFFALNAQDNINFHDFSVISIDGDTVNLSDYSGKKILVVNTASKCGYTKQYKDLQELYSKYESQNFVIIGFPANNFRKQEPGTNAEIKEFCSKNYGVSFPLMAKISVKGDNIHPVYQWLTNKSENKVKDSEVAWNFQKYLIDEEGNLVDFFPSKVKPRSTKITNWIEGK